jgi:integrase
MPAMGRNRTKDFSLPPRMYRKGNAFYYVTPDRKWIPLGTDLPMAKVKWANLEGSSPSGTFTALADKYLSECLSTLAVNTQKNYTYHSKPLVQAFGKMRLDQIKPHHVAGYLDAHDSKAAANIQIGIMSTMLERAMRWGWIDKNVCKGVRRNAMKKRDRYITDDEFIAIRSVARDWVACAMDIAYLTGARESDIVKIRLSDFSDDGLYIRQKKTDKAQLFHMTEPLREALDRAKQLERPITGMNLFHSGKGKPYSPQSLGEGFRIAAKKAGVLDVHFHDIRAKAGTDAKRTGLDYQALLGHASSAMSDRYMRLREVEKVQPLGKKL